jgi:hypothetical protein
MYDMNVDQMVDDVFDQFNPKKKGKKAFEYDFQNNFDRLKIEDYGFDTNKTVAHGTNLEKAININRTRELTDGTFTYPGRGGIDDARLWAKNVYSKDPVVIIAETDKENVRGTERWDFGWVTLGKRAEERSGIDTTYNKLNVKKLMIAKVNDDGSLEEIYKG